MGVLGFGESDLPGGVVGGLMGAYPELTPHDRTRVARLNSLWVHPSQRSSGLGARLVEEFLAWARERGARYAEVSAYTTNQGAVRFYERQGFAPQLTVLRANL